MPALNAEKQAAVRTAVPPSTSSTNSLNSDSPDLPVKKLRKPPKTKKLDTLLKDSPQRIHEQALAITGASQTTPTTTPSVSSPSVSLVSLNADKVSATQAAAVAIDETYADLEKKAQARRLALVDSDNLPKLNPAEVLLIDIRRTHTVVNEMARRIAPMLAALPDPGKLDPDSPTYDRDRDQVFAAFLQMTAKGSKPHAFLELMLNFQKHLTNVAKSALDADIADRMASVAEADAMDMIELIRNIFYDENLDMTVRQRQEFPKVLRHHVEIFREKRARKRHEV